tara:strand:+ start:557 stop:772 length:216 start_codon:yes stop_codon:yes gene_type:complete
MSDLLVVEGAEYRWLNDFMHRFVCGEEVGTHDDLYRIAGLVERSSCCERCERIWNESLLEKAGYEKKGGGI